jgi:uncharacterized protein (TIGR03435 family)
MKFSYWDETFRLMAQTMLADRFKLATHAEQRPMNVFVLVEGKGGARLQKAAGSGMPECTRTVVDELQAEAICSNITMADPAHAMQVFAPLHADREVVDMTGIRGAWDVKLNWAGRLNAAREPGGQTMQGALEKQLGLKLEPAKLPMRVIVVDHVERPSEN